MFWLSRDLGADSKIDLWMDKPPRKSGNGNIWQPNGGMGRNVLAIDARELGLPTPEEGQLIAVQAKTVIRTDKQIETMYDFFICADLRKDAAVT